jgi:hypothetical protein
MQSRIEEPKAMSRIIVAATLLALAFTSAHAVDWDATAFTAADIPKAVAALQMYQTKCRPLPPKTKEVFNLITPMADRSAVTAEILNIQLLMNRHNDGVHLWCIYYDGVIEEMEKGK